MEDILEMYRLPYDPDIPMICMDEQPYQFLGEKREPVPMKPGKTAMAVYFCHPHFAVGERDV
jgi:hypothetical protein